jgi:hypothetical protein
VDPGGGTRGGLADGAADVGLFLLDEDGRGGEEGDTDAATFVAAAAAAVAVVEFDADGSDGVGELLEEGAYAPLDEGLQGAGEGDATCRGDDVHGGLRKRADGSLLAGIFDSSTTKILRHCYFISN